MNQQQDRPRIPDAELVAALPRIALDLGCEPNPRMSKPNDLRYGRHGSLSIDPVKGMFFDHEANYGGGVIAFIRHKRRCEAGDAVEYARQFVGQWTQPMKVQPVKPEHAADWHRVANFVYADANGTPVYRVVRLEDRTVKVGKRPKRISQEHFDAGKWASGLNGAAPLLYRLPDLLASAADGDTVFIVEGEPKAEMLRAWGLTATCNSGGAGKWDASFAGYLTGRDVVILPDNDEAGRKHAALVLDAVKSAAASVHVVTLPGLAEKEDVVDWAGKGGDRDQLIDLVRAAVEAAKPQPETPAPGFDDILPMINPTSWAGLPVPQRQWHVPELIPHKTVTALSGDGGMGKSLLAMQLAVSTAMGGEWIGQPVEPGRVMYLSAEDDQDEVWRRLADITSAYGGGLEGLTNLRVVPLAGMDAVLAAPEARSNVIKPTALWEALEYRVKTFGPRLLVLDTLADLFAGDEVQRAQARQFIGLLRGLAIRYDIAVLLLLHPSLSGMASGRGSSGSTAWVNSIRSFLFFDRVRDEDGKEIDVDVRTLKTTKANYGRIGSQIGLKWQGGIFVNDEELGVGWIERKQSEAKIDAVFLELVGTYSHQGRPVSPNHSSNYAPTVFAKAPSARGLDKKVLEKSMNRLLGAGKLSILEQGRAGRITKILVVNHTENRSSDEPENDA